MVNYYKHLTLGERNTIEEYLNKNKSARSVALSLNRSVTTITNEVKRNRIITRGKYKSIPAKEKLANYSIDKICHKLQK